MSLAAQPSASTPPHDAPSSNEEELFALPVSFAQERLWLLEQLTAGSATYNSWFALRLTGPLDVAALEHSLCAIVERHETLRTTFAIIDGTLMQLIAPSGTVAVPMIDLRDLPAGERAARVQELTQTEAEYSFDLTTGPLMRALVLWLTDDEHLLLLTLHHIISDGWSMGVLMREVSIFYAAAVTGQPVTLPELPIQYADFALWQREWLQGDTLAQQLAYWMQRLAGAPTVLELPTDRPRPAVPSQHGATTTVPLPPELARAVQQFSRAEGATLFMTLLAAFQLLLARYSGQRDFLISTPVAGRNRAETEHLIGCFVNSLALRTDLAGSPSFRELLARVRASSREAFAHQDLPFAQLVEALQPQRTMSHAPLCQVQLVVQNAPLTLTLQDLTLSLLPIVITRAKIDLTLLCTETAEGFNLAWDYATDLFDAATIDQLASAFTTLLQQVLAAPDAPVTTLPLLVPDPAAPPPTWGSADFLPTLIAAQAARTPEAVAVTAPDGQLSYQQLDRQANQLAHHLQHLGVGPDVPVAICAPRCTGLVIGLLATLKAGGCYVPLDPRHPPARQAAILAAAQPPVVLTVQALADQLPAGSAQVLCLDAPTPPWADQPTTRPVVALDAHNLAYILFTSGSTGTPKGVLIPHGGLANYLRWATTAYDVAAGRGAPVHSPIGFDLTVTSLWLSLTTGGTVELLPEEESGLSALSTALCQAQNYSLVKLTPAHVDVLRQVLPPSAASAARALVIGGEALHGSSLRWWQQHAPQTRLFNEYGPTETVVGCCVAEVTHASEEGALPIGVPIAHTQLYVLDWAGQVVPPGGVGELFIGGAGVARGYLNRPELTAERFVPDPFSSEVGARLYRTGDWVRRRADGVLDYLGRIDHQVKVRGYRIELGEIEAVLHEHPEVAHAAVIVREDVPGDKRLVGYVVPRGDGLQSSALQDHLRRRVPEYMIPTAFVLLDALPMTTNGKLDRQALPVPEGGATEEHAYVAPQTPIEERLAAIWAEVLRVPQVSVTADFFALGGHSLLATQVLARVRDTFAVELPLRAFFDTPTVRGLAAPIAAAVAGGTALSAPPLVRRERGDALPLSFAQERLWFLDQLEPGNPAYNIPIALRLTGNLHLAALQQSLATVVQRHEILRTHFTEVEDRPTQQIRPTQELVWTVLDLREIPADVRAAQAQQVVAHDTHAAFDLATGPLLRPTIIHLTDTEHLLLLTMHHIIADGWSMGVLVREIGATYAAVIAEQPVDVPELPIQYADYALWQRDYLAPGAPGAVLEQQLAYWTQQLADAPAVLELPTDRPRPATPSPEGATHAFTLSPQLTSAVQQLSRAEGATLFMTLLAAFQVLLSRYSGQADIVVGSPVAGRTQAETEDLIGCFVNTLALRSDLSGQPSFRALVQQVRETTLDAYAHQDVPFEKLVEALHVPRNLSHTPLFQALFVLQNTPHEPLVVPGLTLEPLTDVSHTAKFDLSLEITETADGLTGQFEYATDLFTEATIVRMVAHFTTLLEHLVTTPDRPITALPLLTEAEQQQMLHAWNATDLDFPREQCFHQLFEAQVERTPSRIAAVCGAEQLTYAQLNQRANSVAHTLVGQGIGPGQIVAILAERGTDFLSAVLGIFKAGGAYLPLDPAHPPARLATILRQSRARLVLVAQAFQPAITDALAQLALEQPPTVLAIETLRHHEQPRANLPRRATPQDLAYVIFTSGSTGLPKGAMVEQLGMVNHIYAKIQDLQLTAEDRIIQNASQCFDISVWQFLTALLIGAQVHIVPNEIAHDPVLLLQHAEQHAISILEIVPSLLRAALDELPQASAQRPALTALRWLILTGEALPPDLARKWLRAYPQIPLLNAYGPTECSDDVTHYPITVPPAEEVIHLPIGRPVANTQLYILDQQLMPVPVGVPGQIAVGGIGVGRGYLYDVQRTAQVFISNPFSAGPGARLYLTGDLGRYLPDGSIEYLRRIDHQVKVRGFRIELGEIEVALSEHPDVAQAVVIVREDTPGDHRIVAYVVAQADASLSISDLRSWMQARLPAYMIPAAIVPLTAIPLTPNGKVDRKALPIPDVASAAREQALVPPRTAIEAALVIIWSEVLGTTAIGVYDDFFDLGGHSLLATQLVSKIRKIFQVNVPLRQVFEATTIAALAEVIVAAETQPGRTDKIAQMFQRIKQMSAADVATKLQEKKTMKEDL